MKNIKGFTFIEIILVVSIILIVGVSASVFSGNFFFDKNVSGLYGVFQSNIRKAQLYSMEGRGGLQWGVALRNGSLVLFGGSNYENRDVSFDETYDIPGIVVFSGFDEIVAKRGAGRISGSLTSLHMEGSGGVKDFSITQEGAFREGE